MSCVSGDYMSSFKDWHGELTKESRSLQREELVKSALRFEEEAYETAESRAQYYQLVMERNAAMRRGLGWKADNGGTQGPVANTANMDASVRLYVAALNRHTEPGRNFSNCVL